MEIFLYYPAAGKQIKKINPDKFFAALDESEEKLTECEVFLNQTSALQYSRFMHKNHVILKAEVPQEAISGHSLGFTLRKGFLSKDNIHGCYPGWAKGMLYVENPLLPNAKTGEDSAE